MKDKIEDIEQAYKDGYISMKEMLEEMGWSNDIIEELSEEPITNRFEILDL
jgi:hypothetical protein